MKVSNLFVYISVFNKVFKVEHLLRNFLLPVLCRRWGDSIAGPACGLIGLGIRTEQETEK